MTDGRPPLPEKMGLFTSQPVEDDAHGPAIAAFG